MRHVQYTCPSWSWQNVIPSEMECTNIHSQWFFSLLTTPGYCFIFYFLELQHDRIWGMWVRQGHSTMLMYVHIHGCIRPTITDAFVPSYLGWPPGRWVIQCSLHLYSHFTSCILSDIIAIVNLDENYIVNGPWISFPRYFNFLLSKDDEFKGTFWTGLFHVVLWVFVVVFCLFVFPSICFFPPSWKRRRRRRKRRWGRWH